MKTAIICYDLKDVGGDDNSRVKAALSRYINTLTSIRGNNLFSSVPEWVRLKLPDTTLLALVPNWATENQLMVEVMEVIRSVWAEPDRVYIAFIDAHSHLLFNAQKTVEPSFLSCFLPG